MGKGAFITDGVITVLALVQSFIHKWCHHFAANSMCKFLHVFVLPTF